MLFALGAGLWHLLKVQKCSLNLKYFLNKHGVLILPLKVINNLRSNGHSLVGLKS